MNKDQLKKLLDKVRGDLGIPEEMKIELKPMKIKAASISLKRNTIRINKNLISCLDQEAIEYLILHELIHYKLKSRYHNGDFYKQLYERVDAAKAGELERRILTCLLEVNYIL